MRVVADTNIVVSGLLWHGPPRRVLEAARDERIQLLTTGLLLAELEDVLARPKFTDRLGPLRISPHELAVGYAALAEVTSIIHIEPVIAEDPDDDVVLACALSGHADAIVSGDSHLLSRADYRGMPILSATQLLEVIPPSPSTVR